MRAHLPTAARNPVAQFLVAGLLAGVAVTWATSSLSGQAARSEAVRDARARTELLAQAVVEPLMPRGLVDRRAGAVDRFDRAMRARGVDQSVDRLKLWREDGTILYSDQTRLIGRQFPLGGDERATLQGGPTAAEVSDLSKPENRFERETGGLLEVYTSVHSPEGEPLLFEVYYTLHDVRARQREIADAFRPIALGGVVALLVVATSLIWLLWRRVQRAADERARLLTAAVDASDAERRRIARDLHDGVVQDLTATTYRLAASAAAPGVDSTGALAEASASVRTSLRSLRSLLVEIYPPDLRADGLAGALDDLLASAQAAGVEVSAELDDLTGVPEPVVALVWRVAQEGVRNALRHAGANALTVEVRREEQAIVLRVRDDGVGFHPDEAHRGRLGLRGLRDLAAEQGATLDVRSAPGEGTDLALRVERR